MEPEYTPDPNDPNEIEASERRLTVAKANLVATLESLREQATAQSSEGNWLLAQSGDDVATEGAADEPDAPERAWLVSDTRDRTDGPDAPVTVAVAAAATTGKAAPWVVLTLFLTFLIYAPSIGNDFTWDDKFFAKGSHEGVVNPMVAELHPPASYWQAHYWEGRAETSRVFRPLTVLSYAVRHSAFGDDPLAAHALNVFLHLLCVWLAYLLLRTLFLPWRTAVLGAAVFAVHAIHSEAVANVAGRAELLAFACGAAGVVLLFRARGRGPALAAAGYVASAFLLFLAFSSKESALAWAAFVPCYAIARHWLGPKGYRWPLLDWRWSLDALAIAAPVLAYLTLRASLFATLPEGDPTTSFLENPLLEAPLATRVMTGTVVWGKALLMTAFPFGLSAEYGNAVLPIVEEVASPGFVVFLFAALCIVGVLAMGLRCCRREPLLFLAMTCVLGFSFIVTNIPIPVLMMFAERTYYTPSLAISFVVAWGVKALQQRHTERHIPLATVALGAWAGACVLVVLQRNTVWKNDETLIRTETENQPESVRMQLLSAFLHSDKGRLHAALSHFERAAALDPGHADSWHQCGVVLHKLGRTGEALSAYRTALRGRAAEVVMIADRLWSNVGRAEASLGHDEWALDAFEKSRACNPAALRRNAVCRRFLMRLVKDPGKPVALRQRAARLGLELYGPTPK